MGRSCTPEAPPSTFAFSPPQTLVKYDTKVVHRQEPLMLATAGLDRVTAPLVYLAGPYNLLIQPPSPIVSRISSTVKPQDRRELNGELPFRNTPTKPKY